MISRTASPAIRSPATGGVKEILPGSDLLPPFSSPVSLPDTSTGFSFEYNTFTPWIPLAFSSFLITLQSGQTDVLLITAISNSSGYSLLPVPMQLISGISSFFAFSITASFAVTVSMASMI